MALGNWDSFVVNEKGELTEGIFKFKDISVIIYKNWIHIEDKKSWTEDCHFVKPIVMVIKEGLIDYKGIRIVARREDKFGSLYFSIWTGYSGLKDMKGIFGVATYCYDGENYVGVREFQKTHFKKFIKKTPNWEYYTPNILDKIEKFDSYNQGTVYIVKNLANKM